MMRPGIDLRAGPIPPTVQNRNLHALVLYSLYVLLHWKSKYCWFSAGSLKAGRSCAGLEVE